MSRMGQTLGSAARAAGPFCCALLLTTAPLGAQAPVPTTQTFDAVVKTIKGGGQHVRLPVNKSAVIQCDRPVERVAIGNPDVADATVVSPRQVLVTGKSYGATQLVVWADQGRRQRVFEIFVEMEVDKLVTAIEAAAPRAKVRAHAVLDSVVLTGTVPDAATADQVLQIAGIFSTKVRNNLQVAGVQQVLLRCTVAEVSRRAIRQLGFNGWIGGDNLHDVFAVNQLDGINPVNIGAARDFGPIGGPAAAAIPFGTDFQEGLPLRQRATFSIGFPRIQMQLFIQAVRENNLLRILAEPNLVTTNGRTAAFLAGGEFPVPIPQDQNTITIEFKEFGVKLNFTPYVLGGQRIRLKVAPEVSEPDFTNSVQFQGFVIPGLSVRKAETTVELGTGQTIAIAGLLSESVRGVTRRLPGLGDVPILGTLFSSNQYQKNQSELVILVTPELVSGMNPDQIAHTPGEYMTDPNDHEFFLMGRLEGPPKPPPLAASPDPGVLRDGAGTPAATTSVSPVGFRGPWGPAVAEETH